MSRAIVYGQAPSRTTDGAEPLSGSSGETLAKLAGVTTDEMKEIFVLRNLLAKYAGREGVKGDAFPIVEARKAAMNARSSFKADDVVVLLGRNVARAFDLTDLLYLVWSWCGKARVIVIPHPSHVNIYYNNAANRLAVSDVLTTLVQEFADAR